MKGAVAHNPVHNKVGQNSLLFESHFERYGFVHR